MQYALIQTLLKPHGTEDDNDHAVDQQDKDSKEFLYFTELHVKLMSNPDYKSKFYEAVVECGKGKQ